MLDFRTPPNKVHECMRARANNLLQHTLLRRQRTRRDLSNYEIYRFNKCQSARAGRLTFYNKHTIADSTRPFET